MVDRYPALSSPAPYPDGVDGALHDISERDDFSRSRSPFLLLDADLRIRAVNDAYLRAAGRDRDALLGLGVFDAFPDNPDDPDADGVRNLGASLEHVLRTGSSHDMVIQRYDVSPGGDRGFVEKLWSPVNTPVLDDRRNVVGVLHHVEDLTELVHLAGTNAAAVLGDVARDQLRDLIGQALSSRSSESVAPAASNRFSAALSAIVSARYGPGPSPGSARRARLWELVVRSGEATTWTGWSDAVCRVAALLLPDVAGCTVSLSSQPGLHRLVAASSPEAERLDELDYVLGEGPIRTAVDTGAPVLVDDLLSEAVRWPVYSRVAAAELGVTGVAAFPLRNGSATVGAFALYRTGRQRLAGRGLVDAALLADLTTAVIVADLDEVVSAVRDGPGGLPSDRVAIAVGITCVQLGVGPDEALDRIRARAFAAGRSVSAVADDIVGRRLHLD